MTIDRRSSKLLSETPQAGIISYKNREILGKAQKSKGLVGLFLISVSFSMFVLGMIYLSTGNLNYAWLGFGIVYACSLFGILGNKKLKDKLGVGRDSRIIKPASIVVLAIGLILSYAIGANFGERYLLLGILITVGLHFLPFGGTNSFVLSILVVINGVFGIFLPLIPVWIFIFIDGVIKLSIGVWMCLEYRSQSSFT